MRVVETPGLELTVEKVAVSELRTYHQNPRKGDVAAIRESLRVNGQYRPIVANRGTHTGRSNEVLAGNHTLMAARDEGWSAITVSWVDVDDDQCARIVAADNRLSDRGGYDERLLVELLSGLEDDLAGTGYEPGDLAALEKALGNAGDDPIYGDADVTELDEFSRTVVIACEDERNQQSILAACNERGWPARAVTR